MFWLVVWIAIVVIVFGTFFWSIATLLKQKKAWKVFSTKYKLTYASGKFLQSPSLEGVIAGYKALVFSESRPTNDARGKRYVTVVQLTLPSGMPTEGAVASPFFAELIRVLDFPYSVKITHEGWDYTLIAQAKDSGALEVFLTPARLAALDGLAKIKGCTMLYVFDRQETFLRLETFDALEMPQKLDSIIKKLISAANILSTQAKEQTKEKPAP